MAAETPQDASSYIQHHLTFFAEPVREQGGFWTVHYDTIITSLILGVLVLGRRGHFSEGHSRGL